MTFTITYGEGIHLVRGHKLLPRPIKTTTKSAAITENHLLNYYYDA